jgi:pyridinium-3,5-bisthiocarboxylic acid mononucleotide nickel chelatase
MAKTAYFDCLSGISGDMTLGALVDLGVEVDRLQSGIRSMGIDDIRIHAEVVKKAGFRATQIRIEHPPQKAHRHLHHIVDMIDRGTEISDSAKETAKAIFHVIAVAEAKMHHSTLQKVHFHEVGAIDSIADIVGTAIGLEALGIESVMASPVPTGHGSITIDHGRVSVPAPATAEILIGIPIAASNIEAELTTPTGAAILKSLASSFGPMPAMTIEAVGYGSGTMNLPGQPNVLRILLGETPSETAIDPAIESDRVVLLESNLDDCSPQQIADAVTRLFDAGALDVWQTPCVMKKGRSGVVLSVLTTANRVSVVESILFLHTTTIGIRRSDWSRHKLARVETIIETKWGPVRAKTVTLPGGQTRIRIEDDDARDVANRFGISADEVRRSV